MTLSADREAAIVWLMSWYHEHPGVAPWRLEQDEPLIDPDTDERIVPKSAVFPAGMPPEIRTVLERSGGYLLSLTAIDRLRNAGELDDEARMIRPIGWQR